MVGIKAYGLSLPLYRLNRGEINKAWKMSPFPMRGERSTASHDEDSLTLAVNAARDGLVGIDPKSLDGIFCCSTTFPYYEKLSSTIAAAALDMKPEIRAVDLSNSLRSGTIAFALALDAIKAGSAQNLLVTASDCRLGAPGGDLEQSIGDAGVALLLGKEDLIAEVEDTYTVADEFCGMWRSNDDRFIRLWEDRMVHDEGYSKILDKAITGCLKKCGLSISDFDKIVYDAPSDPRRHAKLAKKLGITKDQLQNTFFETVGHTGTALAPMMLVAALDEAKPGDRILFAAYGNGADVNVLRVTEAISTVKNRGTFLKQLEKKKMLEYPTYLKWRNLVPIEEAKRPKLPATSISNLHRNEKILLGLYGVKCKECGTVQYTQAGMLSFYVMPERICIDCGAKDQFEDYRFADKKGTLFSYTQDNLTAAQDPPMTVGIIDFEGGGRGAFEVTDKDFGRIDVDAPVELTFRHLFFDGGIHNYYWKVRPCAD